MPKKLNETTSFETLTSLQAPNLKEVLTPERISSYVVKNSPITFSYANSHVDDTICEALFQLAKEQDVVDQFKALKNGDIVNKQEGRQVLHHLTRDLNRPSFFQEQYQKIVDFTDRLQDNTYTSFSGKPFTDIVQVGIGGSKLGPESLHLSFETYSNLVGEKPKINAYFMGNSDPTSMIHFSEILNLETTLFVFVSKSGTTKETLSNINILEDQLKQVGIDLETYSSNLVAITCKGTKLDSLPFFKRKFYIAESIGGRFSSTSAVGIALLMACFGADHVTNFLKGAHKIDQAAEHPDPRHNASLMAALISVWESSCLGYTSRAIIPYSSGFTLFPYFLQQLICESNGKQSTINDEFLDYPTAPIIFGEVGTNCQHSFFQLLHQGKIKTPVQFIGFKDLPITNKTDAITYGQDLLLSNLISQPYALAVGEDHNSASKHFFGNRPSSFVIGDHYDPFTFGALLAFYENMVAFEGFLLHVNSFDQEGVKLGKKLADTVLSQTHNDPILTAYRGLFS